MGWKGMLRSVSAAQNRSAKASERETRAYEKLLTQRLGEVEVDKFESFLKQLSGLHSVILEPFDWVGLASKPRPIWPIKSLVNTQVASKKFETYEIRPKSFFFRKSDKKRQILLNELDDAKKRDEQSDVLEEASFQAKLVEWQEDHAMALRMLDCDEEAVLLVIEHNQSLTDEALLGKTIGFQFVDSALIAKLIAHDIELVPSIRRKQLASGRLSETKMPIAERNDLYQDYIVSATMRVAIEVFNMTCLDEIVVNTIASMLDRSTGHMEDTCILSVKYVRQTVQGMNLDNIDPSDSLVKFLHNMKYSRTKGFQETEMLH